MSQDQYVNFMATNARLGRARIEELEGALWEIVNAIDSRGDTASSHVDLRNKIKRIAETALEAAP